MWSVGAVYTWHIDHNKNHCCSLIPYLPYYIEPIILNRNMGKELGRISYWTPAKWRSLLDSSIKCHIETLCCFNEFGNIIISFYKAIINVTMKYILPCLDPKAQYCALLIFTMCCVLDVNGRVADDFAMIWVMGQKYHVSTLVIMADCDLIRIEVIARYYAFRRLI